MPRKTKSSPPPKVMTWGKATPALVISGIFDALRLMFVGFIFFGPAMAGLYCDYKAGEWVGAAFGLTKAACAGGAVALGFFGAPALIAFGTVMAMAVGFAGWLAVGGWLLMTNSRIFKENALWFVGSLLFSEVPFIGAIPAITVSVWKMHSNQIKIEKAVFAKWKKENAEEQAKKRSQQEALYIQAQQAQQAQVIQQAQIQQQEQVVQQEELQKEDESEKIEQRETENEEENKNEEIIAPVAPVPVQSRVTPPQPTRTKAASWSPNRGVPPPLTEEYGYRRTPPPLPPQPPPLPEWAHVKTPPPLPPEYLRSIPPPLPDQTHAMPPPLPTGVPNYSVAIPPPLPQMETQPILQTNEHEVGEAGVLNIPIIDRGLMDLGISGPEKMAEFLNEKRNLPSDAPIYLYHGLNGGLGKALSLLESKEQGLRQISGPALAVFPVGQFWKPGDAGLRYSIPRSQIEFPGEHNPTAQFQLDDKGVVLLRNGLDTLPFTKFEGEVMRTEGTETHQEWREINGRSKRVDVETAAPLTDKEIEVGRKIEEKMKKFSDARKAKENGNI